MEVTPYFGWSGLKLRVGPFGLHLFERKTGLNEVRVPPEQWARAAAGFGCADECV